MISFAESDQGVLYLADGMGPVERWDGQTTAMEPAGIVAPTVALTLASGGGSGNIIGTYFAFVRYLDRFGFVSDLSPVSNTFTAAGSGTGLLITGATNAIPIVITAAGHGLSTGNIISIAGVLGNMNANGSWTITVVDVNTFSLDDSQASGDYTSGGVITTGVGSIVYTNVSVSADPKVVRRQILRNTDGQADTFYVDVDTTDLSSTTFTSTLADSDLAADEVQPLLDQYGDVLANTHGVPPDHKPFLVYHLGRMFMAGQRDYVRGMVKVTTGSATVTGVGTDWLSALASRYLYVDGATQSYQILSVDVTNQTLTLTGPYLDGTTIFGLYAIRPAPAERRAIYFSEAGQPESVPAFNALTIPEDGDEITGLLQQSSYVYVLEKRRIWKITFQDDPARDGALFPSINRGCINNESFAVIDNKAYMMDEEGCYIFASGDAQPISDSIQEIFRQGSGATYRINWQAQENFHCVASRSQSTIRWFVCLSGMTKPRHALCYNYRFQRWWLEEYPFPVGASCAGRLGNTDQAFSGAIKVVCLQQGFLDAPDVGSLAGALTDSTLLSLTDGLAAFDASLVGFPVTIGQGRGKGQTRLIVGVSSTVLTIDRPWFIQPDTTSTYQVGGVAWHWLSSWFRFSSQEDDQRRRLEMAFQPTKQAAKMDVRFYTDFADEADQQGVTKSSKEGGGVAAVKGDTDLVVDMTKRAGLVQIVTPGHREYYADGGRFTQFEMAGVSTNEKQAVYSVFYEGAANVTSAGQDQQGGGQ